VLPRDRWRRRVDPGRAEARRDFPQSLPWQRTGGPVYLLGHRQSIETRWSALASFPRKRESGSQGFQRAPLDPRFRGGGGIIVTSSRDVPRRRPQGLCPGRHHPQGRRPSDDLRRPLFAARASFAHLPIYGSMISALCRAARPEPSSPGIHRPRRPRSTQLARSFVHAIPGMYACTLLQEGVRQMRGTAPARIPDTRISVCHGCGRHVRRFRHDHHVERGAL